MKRKLIVTLISIFCLIMSGCQSTAENVPASQNENTSETGKEDETPESKPENKKTSKKDKKKDRKEDKDREKSLAERMVGKYSYDHAGEAGEEEFYVMDVVCFGDNLYAFCGKAFPGDDKTLGAYTFWASEFIPYDAGEMKSTDGDTVKVNELRFSVMSNAGKYWDKGHPGTITLTEEGLVFKGFDHDGFLVPDNDNSRLFLKDERVEDAFSYLKKGGSGPDNLQGFWSRDGEDSGMSIEFSGPDMYIYQKSPDREVFFAAGGCNFNGDSFECTASCIDAGAMPLELSGDYKVEGDRLTLDINCPDMPELFPDHARFLRKSKDDIHVTTMDEVRFDADSFGAIGYTEQEPFFGLWVEAFGERSDAEALVVRLKDKELPASYVFSCDWENLNRDPYYCVTIGRSGSEEEAQAYIEAAKFAGYPSAYVKYTGNRLGHRFDYTVFDESKIEISPEKAVIKNALVDDLSGDGNGEYPLIVDSDTVFDKSCDMQFFAYYQEGMTPLEWFNHINDIKDTDQYQAQGGALMGVFEVDITGNHIDRFYGSYWWD